MTRSYLPQDNKDIKEYKKQNSYVVEETATDSVANYHILPEEYSVFSEIDQNYFLEGSTKQSELISKCLNYMKEQLRALFVRKGIIGQLPKLHCDVDSDGAVSFGWAYSGYRIFFFFEEDNECFDAYSGVVMQNDEDIISTKTQKLTINNYQQVIGNALKLIIENS